MSGPAVRARDLRIVWKWALSESDLDRTAKLVGHVIAQHMDGGALLSGTAAARSPVLSF